MRELVAGRSRGSRAVEARAANAVGGRVGAVPADALLHPVALVAILLLILNDHVLKQAWPGVLSGKLSDVCGLIVFPLFLQAVLEVGQWLSGRWRGPDRRLLTACVIATGCVFALVKTLPLATELYEAAWGTLQWLPTAVADSLAGIAAPGAWQVRLVADPTDLIALPAAFVPLWLGRRHDLRRRD